MFDCEFVNNMCWVGRNHICVCCEVYLCARVLGPFLNESATSRHRARSFDLLFNEHICEGISILPSYVMVGVDCVMRLS